MKPPRKLDWIGRITLTLMFVALLYFPISAAIWGPWPIAFLGPGFFVLLAPIAAEGVHDAN